MNGQRLDLSSEPPTTASGSPVQPPPQRYLGVHFECCDVYARVYANLDGSAYVGHCPRCAKRVRFRIGPDGVDARFFRVR